MVGVFFVMKRGEHRMLTDKQERFAQCIALEGMNQSDAYRESYNAENMTDKSIWEKASELASNVKVRERIFELKDKVISPLIMDAKERKELLSMFARNTEEKTEVRIKSIDTLNKMDGEYVQKIEATVDSVNINVELVEEE